MMDDKVFNELVENCEEAITFMKEQSPCPVGCLFHKGVLVGDCRAPGNKDCELNRRDRDRCDVSLEE